MAAYATLAQIQAFIPKWRIAADTIPSSAEVTAHAERLSARIDGIAAGQGYTVPLSGTQTLNIVQTICLVGTAWYVGRTLFPTQPIEAVTDYRREFEEMMMELISGTLVLVDASKDSSGTTSILTATTDRCVASEMVPYFRRDTVY